MTYFSLFMEHIPESLRRQLQQTQEEYYRFLQKTVHSEQSIAHFAREQIQKLHQFIEQEMHNRALTHEEKHLLQKINVEEKIQEIITASPQLASIDFANLVQKLPWDFLACLFIDEKRYQPILQRLYACKDHIREKLHHPKELEKVGITTPTSLEELFRLEEFMRIKAIYVELLKTFFDISDDILLAKVMKMVFDHQEPGYYQGMVQGMSYIFQTLRQRWGAENLLRLHSSCVEGVRHGAGGEFFRKGFRTSKERIRYGLDVLHVTKAAMKENVEQKFIANALVPFEKHHEYLAKFGSTIPKTNAIYVVMLQNENIDVKVEKMFSHYYEEIQKAPTDHDKLLAIARLAKNLEILHPFCDANQRTIAFCLVTKLLLENGFSPAILEDPSMFDGYFSLEELVQHLNKGMQTFQTRYQQYRQQSH